MKNNTSNTNIETVTSTTMSVNILYVQVVDTSNRELVEYYSKTIKSVGYTGDSGVNLIFPETITLESNSVTLVGLGVKCCMKKHYLNASAEPIRCMFPEYIAYELFPRSSISNTPLGFANSVGLIDAGYRGEIKVALRNYSGVSYTINKGDALAQIVAPNRKYIRTEIVDTLDTTERGDRGFGSSTD